MFNIKNKRTTMKKTIHGKHHNTLVNLIITTNHPTNESTRHLQQLPPKSGPPRSIPGKTLATHFIAYRESRKSV